MERKLISLRMNEGFQVPSLAWTTDVPGLVITQATDTHQVYEGRYCITHEPSGQKLVNWEYESLEVAQIYVQQIAKFMDYTQDGREYYESARAIAAELWHVNSELNTRLREDPAEVLFGKADDGAA